MPNNCTACINNSRNTRNISYFSLPRDAVKRRKWLSIIGRHDLIDRIGHLKTAPNHYKICEEHFESNCFIHNFRLDTNDTTTTTKYKSVKFLSSDALPTLNLRQTKGTVMRASPELSTLINKEIKQIQCSYYGCQNSSESFTMFRFPAKNCHRAVLAIWLQNAGNKHLYRLSSGQLRNRYLCDAHFDKSFIQTGPGTTVLSEDAVPFKTLKVMKPVKVYSRTTSSEGSDEGTSMNAEYEDSGRSSDSHQSFDEEEELCVQRSNKKFEDILVQIPPANAQRPSLGSDYANSDEIRVEVKLEPTEDERLFKTVLCIEVPPLRQSMRPSSDAINIKTEPAGN